ncbi:MAG TPA: hypothetical protein VEB59_15065 [Gemmatimonadales bacterium]|nr:hypothetical protein [Gemmatimonadales bacterium]
MALDPLKSGHLPPADAGRIASSQASKRDIAPARADDERQAASSDSVELSAASRGLSDGTEAVPSGTISAERLREVARRLAQDHYDTSEVRDTVARRALRDLGPLGTEQR